jgi:hypothetical protein
VQYNVCAGFTAFLSHGLVAIDATFPSRECSVVSRYIAVSCLMLLLVSVIENNNIMIMKGNT